MKTAWRKIECNSYSDLCAYTLAFEDMAHMKGCKYTVEPTFINVETLIWFRIVRINAETAEELLPFKELLNGTIDQIYDYLREANERSAEVRRVRGW